MKVFTLEELTEKIKELEEKIEELEEEKANKRDLPDDYDSYGNRKHWEHEYD